LYRLTAATGSYEHSPRTLNRYNLNVGYDDIDNVTRKVQAHTITPPGDVALPQHATSYTYNYTYTGTKPHAPTAAGDRTFTYDAAGNQSGWNSTQNATRRTTVWDEENRVQSVSDNGQTTTFKYDDTGTRILKRGPLGEIAYVNPYFTIRNREVAEKQIVVDGTRIASKLLKQDKPGSNSSGSNPYEKDIYFYHPDHLGGTNYVTDKTGALFQHAEYFPGGETWVDEKSTANRTPYLFTGKELDGETGLYYYGARYYDPRVSQFTSTDPILNSGSPYAYANNSPLRFVDPTGGDTWDALSGFGKGVVRGGVNLVRGTVTTVGQLLTEQATVESLAWDAGVAAARIVRDDVAVLRNPGQFWEDMGLLTDEQIGEVIGGATFTTALIVAPLAKAAPATAAEWVLPEGGGGAFIGGRWFTEHALERMAPRTPQVMAELESRALSRAETAGLKPGTADFGKWWGKYGPDPRNIPPSVVEAEIASPGSTGVTVITNPKGGVVTVIPGD
jgi:RHS repeat-associated protein